VHPEGELVVVIGRRSKNIREEDALSCVLGYTIGNDVGQRDWLKTDQILAQTLHLRTHPDRHLPDAA